MTRSLWKGPFCEIVNNTPTKVWSRRSVILPQFIENTVMIHNGKSFISLKITEDMVGHKFGEFATTRRKPQHKKKK
nr:ribosomal protein S19 [Chlorella desiccata (nom. nud.)]